ncbi:MAG: TonB-dependent receptor [Halioglobus sp.]|nr:TonB-dependent receptor [Halioglobus sp.]
MNFRQRALAAPVSLALSLGWVGMGPILAQAQAALEEVVVTARKREETLQETPVAVSVFNGETLEQLGLRDMSDLTKVVPNVDMYEGNGTTGSANIFIRGIGARNTGVNFDSGVGIYVDGVYVSRADGAILDNVDVQSVQVLRGPQGTLFGKNTTGGAILYTTNKPNEEFGGNVLARVGNYDKFDSQGTLNIPLIGDTLMSRFSLFQTKNDGYVSSEIPDGLPPQAEGNFPFLEDEEYSNIDRWGGQAQLRWIAQDNLILDLNYNYTKTNQAARGQNCEVVEGIPGAGWQAQLQDDSVVIPSTGLPIKGWCAINQNLGRDKIMANLLPNLYRAETNTLALTADWDLTDVLNFKSITAWRRTEGGEVNELDAIGISNLGRTNYGWNDAEERNTDAYSQEFQLTGDAFDDRLSYVIGMYGFYEKTDAGAFASPSGPYFNSLSTPTTAFYQNTVTELLTKNTSFSAFSQADWRFDDYWTVTLGVRYTWEERKLDRLFKEPVLETLATTGDATVIVPGTIYNFPSGADTFNPGHQFSEGSNPLNDQSKKLDDSKVNPMVSIQRTFDSVGFMDFGNAYLTIANGFLSGGISDNVDLESGLITEYDPEEVWNYEIGFKMDGWDRRLRFNTAIFYTDYEDRQLTTVRLNPQTSRPQAALINAKESWIAGIEFEAVVLPVENLQITANLTFNDSDIKEYKDERITTAIPGPVPEGCIRVDVAGLAEIDSCPVDRSDEDLPRLPDSIYFLAVQYNWENDWGTVIPMVSYSYRSNLDNCFDYSSCLSGVYKVNQESLTARLTWLSPDLQWRVTAWGNNLSDDRYVQGGTPLVDVTETAGTIYNQPRTYGIEAAYTW